MENCPFCTIPSITDSEKTEILMIAKLLTEYMDIETINKTNNNNKMAIDLWPSECHVEKENFIAYIEDVFSHVK